MGVQHCEKTEVTPYGGTRPSPGIAAVHPGGRRPRVWVNWALALLTVPAAALVMICDVGAAVSTAAASRRRGLRVPLWGLVLLLCDVAVTSSLFSK